jgi:ABC-type nitrate/sulfonate/bicarbonate transport system permease component
MSDPITSSLLTKVISGLSGLVGGISFMAFYRPCNVWDASVRSGLSVISAVVFTPIILEWLKLDMSSDNMVAISVVIGFCSWSILSLSAHLLMGVQDEKVKLKLPFVETKE